jgi:hypothetical protein
MNPTVAGSWGGVSPWLGLAMLAAAVVTYLATRRRQ